MNQKKFLIYTIENCTYCSRAKELLKGINFEYEEIHLASLTEEKVNELMNKTKMRTLPQIFHGERFVGGFSELLNEFNNGVFSEAQK